MKFIADLHTHTTASDHAYSTIMENAKYASSVGIEVLGTTDHGPSMPGAPYIWNFANLRVMPKELFGVTMLYGCEANIIDYEGNIDLPHNLQTALDIVIASLHEPVMEANKDADLNTSTLLKVMDNPNVSILGHLGNPRFKIHEEEIVKKAKEKNILIEINNSSLTTSRSGSEGTCIKIAKLCKELEVPIIVNSDAHFCYSIGDFTAAEKILTDIGMPQDLILNTNKNNLMKFFSK